MNKKTEMTRDEFQSLTQQLYEETLAGKPASDAIEKIQIAIADIKQIQWLTVCALVKACEAHQPEIEDAFRTLLQEEQWDISLYEKIIGKYEASGKLCEAWILVKRYEKKFTIKFSVKKKISLCRNALENPQSEKILDTMLQEDPTDELIKVFQLLRSAMKLRDEGRQEEANELVRQITHSDTSVHLRLGKEIIKEGFVLQGATLVKTATNESRGIFISIANQLFDEGHPREAAEVLEHLLQMGIVRQGTAANASPELSALNQLAKCAKVDSVAKERFDREMKRLQETEELPPEYWRRVMLVYKTGMPVSASKGVYRQSGKRLGIVVQKETRQNMSNISPTIGHVASEGVGELDGSGEAKKKFEMLLEQKLFAEAREYLFTFKEKVHDSIFLIYEKYLYAALTTATQSFELWNKTLDINPDDRSVFILALRDLLHKQRVDLAMQLFSERHGGNLKKGRTFGHLLSETGKRSNALPSRAAMAVLADGHPKLAIEILKPTLLNYISSQHQMPPHLLEAFAYCAAVDAEIRQDFLEQMRDYRRYQGVKDDHIHELLAIVYGQEIERQQSIAEAKRLIQRFSFREDEVQYRGRVARSTFFKDPHTMISAEPIDRKAGIASGNERRKQLKRQDTVDAFEGIPEENIVTIARLLLAEKGLDENNLAHTSPDTFSTLLFSPSITGLHIYNRIMKTALNVLLADHIIAFAQILFPESVENNQEVQETIIKPLEESVLKIREMHTVHDFQTAASLLNIEFSPVALNFNESDAGLLQLIEELQRHRETIQSILLHTTDSTVCKAASRLLKISKTL